ncbi:hypothetical protein BIT28_16105 [Photobacterium proteolyticum]|uniref:Uncharacterized protein n=1 Tax=Photobacterium proteolyticum TaxID=1903952 RepID=A0A1Q9H223_9GAMM|nr:hypothetical protein [Photobacterium proteolyticum]OLQ81716.1 hypothetical protein BIT28_16105 [Photobacterium proteolyticum]
MIKYICIIFLLVSSGFAFGYEFDEYPASERLEVSVSKIDFTGFEQLKSFRENLNQQIKSGPNYGGKYYVAFLGCGTSCQGNIIVDLGSGKIVEQITSCDGMVYKLESKLFIANPKNEDNENKMCPTKKYLVDNGKLTEIK